MFHRYDQYPNSYPHSQHFGYPYQQPYPPQQYPYHYPYQAQHPIHQPHFLQQLTNKLTQGTHGQQQKKGVQNAPHIPHQPYGPGLSSMFMGENGKFDFNKASNALDQVVKTANQVSPIVKQIGSLFTPKT